MVKSSRDQEEQDEKKVLFELVKNSKEKIDTIAKRCGISKQKTWRYIKRLESKGLIWGYTVIFDEEKVGLKHFILLVKRTSKQLDEGAVDRIISRRAEGLMNEFGGTIESSSYVHGEYDWMMTFTAEDIKHAKKYSDSLIALHPGEIEKISILQTLMFIRRQHVLNPNRKKLKEFL
jgi:Lrp/AsnC family leucine-responsive transcriptional regulator